MKKVLVLVFSNLKHDARVTRQVNALKENNLLKVVCFDADETPGVEFIKIQQTKLTLWRKARMGFFLLLKQYGAAYKLFHDYDFLLKKFRDEKFDLIVANDIDTLPLAFKFNKEARIIFDAHEYAPRHFENNTVWRIFFQPMYLYLCKKFIPRVDAMLTVGKGLADEYEKNFGIRPTIITNAARYHEIKPSPIVENKIRLVHHGIANPSRRIELMVEMMDYLDERFTLDMILMTSDYASPQTKAYINSLKQNASKNPRIKISPSVKSNEVVATINQYDMGVFLIPPVNFNYANTLPNKLFDFIQARLGVAIGPTPEMADIVTKYKVGVVSNDFDAKSLAASLNTITKDQLVQFKQNAGNAAKELNAEKNQEILTQLIQQIFNR
jgi:glycosyltransferase involved in cell wall biosynthesis